METKTWVEVIYSVMLWVDLLGKCDKSGGELCYGIYLSCVLVVDVDNWDSNWDLHKAVLNTENKYTQG